MPHNRHYFNLFFRISFLSLHWIKKKIMNIKVSFTVLLFLVFLVLKLTGVIGWSWWWVFSPLWIPFVLVLVLVGIKLWAEK